MSAEKRDIKELFDLQLNLIDESYAFGKRAPTLDTQRSFEQELNHLETTTSDSLDIAEAEQRKGFDEAYRLNQVWRLDAQERAGWTGLQTSGELHANRVAYQTERAALDLDSGDALYRQSEPYQEGMRQLTEAQVVVREWVDEQLRAAEQKLNERFGFDRVAPLLEDQRGAHGSEALKNDVEDRMAQLREDREREG